MTEYIEILQWDDQQANKNSNIVVFPLRYIVVTIYFLSSILLSRLKRTNIAISPNASDLRLMSSSSSELERLLEIYKFIKKCGISYIPYNKGPSAFALIERLF